MSSLLSWLTGNSRPKKIIKNVLSRSSSQYDSRPTFEYRDISGDAKRSMVANCPQFSIQFPHGPEAAEREHEFGTGVAKSRAGQTF
jgi:hypothetical protein